MRYLTIYLIISLVIPPAALLFCNDANAQDITDNIIEGKIKFINYCPNCGVKVEEGYKFCPYCGYELPQIKETKPVEKTTYERDFLQISPTLGSKFTGGYDYENGFTYGGNFLFDLKYFNIDTYFNYASSSGDYFNNGDYSSDVYEGFVNARIPIVKFIDETIIIGPGVGVNYEKYCRTSYYTGYDDYSTLAGRVGFFCAFNINYHPLIIVLLPSIYYHPTWCIGKNSESGNFSNKLGFEYIMRFRFCEYIGLFLRIDGKKIIFSGHSSSMRTLILIGPTIYPH